MEKRPPDKLFRLALIFLIAWLGMTLLLPKPETSENIDNAITVKATDNNYATGQLVAVDLQNKSEQAFTGTVIIEARKEGEDKGVLQQEIDIQPGEKESISFASVEESENFRDPGKFRAVLSNSEGEFISESEFSVEEAGIFRSLWRAIFFKPIYNTLIFFLSVSGGKLAMAIVLLTLIVKFILLVPSKRGIVAQQKMQKLQPDIDKVRKKYGSDPQKQAQEMMALWKKHKIHPGSAFLPVLIQFPILIALFFVVKDGLMPYNEYLLYSISTLQNFNFMEIDYHFLYINLSNPDPYLILPVIVGALQFWQMHTMSVKAKQAKAEKGEKDAEKSPQESVMQMMKYILPVIIVVFSATLPAAVGLYWGVSTVFAIVQQRLLQKQTA